MGPPQPTDPATYSNCLVYALRYWILVPGSSIRCHRGRWWRWVPHFYVAVGDYVIDFKSYPARNGTPFLFLGKPRTRTKEALQRYLSSAYLTPQTMAKRLHHAPKFNEATGKWDVLITESSTGKELEVKTGFATKDEASDWNLQQAVSNATQAAAEEVTVRKKPTGSSKLSF